MFNFNAFSRLDWMGYGGAEPFADGSDPMISVGDVAIDGAETEIILDGHGISIVWVVDDEPYSAMAHGADATRVLAMMRPAMTYMELAALPGIEIRRS